MENSHRLGAWGEDVACTLLEKCGYVCLDRRFRRPGGEIDLVMTRRGLVVFVEVKTRGANALAAPEACLSAPQLRRLRQLALRWLHEHPELRPTGLRFDLVAVHYEGAQVGAVVQHLVGIS